MQVPSILPISFHIGWEKSQNFEKFLLLRSVALRFFSWHLSMFLYYLIIYCHLPKLCASNFTFLIYLSITDINCISSSFYSCTGLASLSRDLWAPQTRTEREHLRYCRTGRNTHTIELKTSGEVTNRDWHVLTEMQITGFVEPVPGPWQMLNEFSSRIQQHLLEIKNKRMGKTCHLSHFSAWTYQARY